MVFYRAILSFYRIIIDRLRVDRNRVRGAVVFSPAFFFPFIRHELYSAIGVRINYYDAKTSATIAARIASNQHQIAYVLDAKNKLSTMSHDLPRTPLFHPSVALNFA